MGIVWLIIVIIADAIMKNIFRDFADELLLYGQHWLREFQKDQTRGGRWKNDENYKK